MAELSKQLRTSHKSFHWLSCQLESEQRDCTVTDSAGSSVWRYLTKSHADCRQTAAAVCLVSCTLAAFKIPQINKVTGAVFRDREALFWI